MPVSLNNSKDIVANSVSVIKGNKLIDVLETVDTIQGLAPDTLNSLEKLATALNNDSNFFQTVSSAIGGKADKTDTFTKAEVTQKFTDIVGGTVEAPVTINTFKKVSDALNTKANATDVYDKFTVDNALNTKSPYFSTTSPLLFQLNPDDENDVILTADAYTKTVIDQKLENATIDPYFTTGLTIFDDDDIAKVMLRTVGPSYIGTPLQITGNFTASGTVMSNGALCLTTNDVFIKTESDDRYARQIDLALKANLNSPSFIGAVTASTLKTNTLSTASGTVVTISNDVLAQGSLDVSGTGKTITARTIQAPAANNLVLAGIVNVGTYLNAPAATIDNLTVTSFFATIPWVAFELRAGTTASVPNDTFSIVFSNGFKPVVAANVTRVNTYIYQFTFERHPNGSNFIPMVVARSGGTSNFYYYATVKFESQTTTTTTCSVWLRKSDNTLTHGDFHFYTVP